MVRLKKKSCVVVFNPFFLVVVTASSFSLPPQVAIDVIKEFAADGVKYLELRSTPREEKKTGKQ